MLRFGVLFFAILPLYCFSQIRYFKLPEHVGDTDYIAKTIIVDIKEEYRGQCDEKGLQIDKLSRAFDFIGAVDVKKKFPDFTLSLLLPGCCTARPSSVSSSKRDRTRGRQTMAESRGWRKLLTV